MELLQRYAWPGNIRELENIIERQVIVTQARRLTLDDLLLGETPRSLERLHPLPHSQQPLPEVALLTEQALSQQQQESAVIALTQAGGKVSGVGGAAELLGIKPTMLASRLAKWRIDPREFRQRKMF